MTLFIALFKEHWKAALIIVIAAFLFIQYHIIKSQRDDARQTIAEMQQEALKQSARVQLLTEQGKRDTASLQASHVKDIQHIGSLYGKALNDDKKSISNYRTQLANQLREQSKSSDSSVPNHDADKPTGNNSDGIVIAEGKESEGYYKRAYLGTREYIETLEQAGSVAAADYNACKAYVDQEQKRIGVYSER